VCSCRCSTTTRGSSTHSVRPQKRTRPPLAEFIEQGRVIALNFPIAMNPGLARALGRMQHADRPPSRARHHRSPQKNSAERSRISPSRVCRQRRRRTACGGAHPRPGPSLCSGLRRPGHGLRSAGLRAYVGAALTTCRHERQNAFGSNSLEHYLEAPKVAVVQARWRSKRVISCDPGVAPKPWLRIEYFKMWNVFGAGDPT
jgi:hypothetical protein